MSEQTEATREKSTLEIDLDILGRIHAGDGAERCAGICQRASRRIAELRAWRDEVMREIAVYLDVLDNSPDESSTSELRALLDRSGYEMPADDR